MTRLAKVRNAVLGPLWDVKPAELEGKEVPRSVMLARNSSGQLHWPATDIVFTNDVFFCAGDVIRLLMHQADLACGFDLERSKLLVRIGLADCQWKRLSFHQTFIL